MNCDLIWSVIKDSKYQMPKSERFSLDRCYVVVRSRKSLFFSVLDLRGKVRKRLIVAEKINPLLVEGISYTIIFNVSWSSASRVQEDNVYPFGLITHVPQLCQLSSSVFTIPSTFLFILSWRRRYFWGCDQDMQFFFSLLWGVPIHYAKVLSNTSSW